MKYLRGRYDYIICKHNTAFLNSITLLLVTRTLNLWDLLSIGVGGTVGSGVFVLTGSVQILRFIIFPLKVLLA